MINQESNIGFPYVGFCSQTNRLIGFDYDQVRVEIITPGLKKLFDEDYSPFDSFFEFDAKAIDTIAKRCIGTDRYSDLTMCFGNERDALITYAPKQDEVEE